MLFIIFLYISIYYDVNPIDVILSQLKVPKTIFFKLQSLLLYLFIFRKIISKRNRKNI